MPVSNRPVVFDEPSATDVHVDAPVAALTRGPSAILGGGRTSGSSRNVSTAYVRKLKNLVTASGKLKPEEFDAMHKTARSHAGVARKAELSKGQTMVAGPDPLAAGEFDDNLDYLAPMPITGPVCGCANCDPSNGSDSCASCDGQDCCEANCPSCSAKDDSDEDEEDEHEANEPRLEKADPRVNYRAAESVGEQCSTCRFGCKGDGDDDADDHMCHFVEGWIDGNMVCDLFSSPKVAASEEPVGPLEFAEACTMCAETGEHKNGWAFFTELPASKEFLEPPAWINYLPKPGIYKSERYGNVVISPQRNQRFVQNFQDAVYQTKLPIDLEHETKLSGAAGYVVGMRMNGDGSADAKIEWTDRGETALRNNRFQYFSPEFYDEWLDPMKPEAGKFKDVAIGGALTTRPFFKERALRSLVMTEQGLAISEEGLQSHTETEGSVRNTMAGEDKNKKKDQTDDDGDEDDMEEEGQQHSESGSESIRMSEIQAELRLERKMREDLEEGNRQLAERTAALETASRRKRFTELVTGQGGEGDGVRWFGEIDENVEFLEEMADSLPGGEENAKFHAFIERQIALGAQLHEAGMFSESGTDAGEDVGQTAREKLTVVATELLTKGAAKSFSEAFEQAAQTHPDWYAEHSDDVRFARGVTSKRS